MGATNNYGLHYPESTDTPDGATQMRQLAEDVDSAIGGVDAKATGIAKVQGGSANISPTTSETFLDVPSSNGTYHLGSVNVTFPSAFSSVPTVVASSNSTVPGVVIEVSVANITTTGCTIYAARGGTSGANVPVSWIAVGT